LRRRKVARFRRGLSGSAGASATATSTRSTITSAAPSTTAADTSTRSSSLPSGSLRAPDPATKAGPPTNPGRRTSLRTLRIPRFRKPMQAGLERGSEPAVDRVTVRDERVEFRH
jgi:hypothetical protein